MTISASLVLFGFFIARRNNVMKQTINIVDIKIKLNLFF